VNRARDSAASALETLASLDEDLEVERQALRRDALPLVLLVDRDFSVRRSLGSALRAGGFKVVDAQTGAQGLALARSYNPDVVLLGEGSPDIDAIAVTRNLRTWTEAPVLFLSTSADEHGKVAALDAGANDFLTRPFGTSELLARIRVWIRCTRRGDPGAPGSELAVEDIRVDLAKRLAYVRGEEVHFTPIEFKLLTFFLRNVGKVVTHERVLVAVWGQAYARETQYLRVFVGQLRQKIERDPAHPRHLVTQPGVGYRLRE
jgi:two-component system KDP operon response regulator KdpE